MLRSISLPELIIIILVLIIFAGSKKMNELAKEAGEATKELKKMKKEYEEVKEEINKPLNSKPEEKK